MVVMSSFGYGSETWVLNDAASKSFLHNTVIKLYRRLLGLRSDGHYTDEDVLAEGQLLSPTEFLRCARLRYLGTLFKGASPDDWSLLNQDRQWLELVQDDCLWLWEQLHHCSCLQDPRSHFESWRYLLRYHPNFWKRLVNRGCKHAALQRRNRHLVGDFHRLLFASLQSQGTLGAEEPCYASPYSGQDRFGCMA